MSNRSHEITTRWMIAFRYRKDGKLRCWLAGYDPYRSLRDRLNNRGRRRRRWKKSGPHSAAYKFHDLADAKRALSCSVVKKMLDTRDGYTGAPVYFVELIEAHFGRRPFASAVRSSVIKRLGVSPLEELALEAD